MHLAIRFGLLLAVVTAGCGSDAPGALDAASVDTAGKPDAGTSDLRPPSTFDGGLAPGDAGPLPGPRDGASPQPDGQPAQETSSQPDAAVDASDSANVVDTAAVIDTAPVADTGGTATHSCKSPLARDTDSAGMCHGLVDCGPAVTFSAGAGAEPLPMGGPMPVGVHVLTAIRVYRQPPAAVTLSQTQFWNGSDVEVVSNTPSTRNARARVSVSVSGTDLSQTFACPAASGPPRTRPYTSTSSGWLDFDKNEARTVIYEYTRVQ